MLSLVIQHWVSALLGKKVNVYVALSRPTVNCESTGTFFLFKIFYVRFGQKNLLKDDISHGLKKHLHDLYMRFDWNSARVFPI